jgi:ATP-dependent RNA helicase DeaD
MAARLVLAGRFACLRHIRCLKNGLRLVGGFKARKGTILNTSDFADLNLHPQLVQAVAAAGYLSPTPIQSAVIPLMLSGRDVIGQAQTGTGKTAAFGLPMLNNLADAHGQVQCLVLAPTRELALQVAGVLEEFGAPLGRRTLAVYGGTPYRPQINQLRRGVEIVVGTPGRILDLIRQKALNLGGVRQVVLDEADEMLSMGFIEDIEAILSQTPTERQTALFSATLPPDIRRLAERYLRQPEVISITPGVRTVATIEQRFYLVNEDDKLAALTRLLEMEPLTSALVFIRTRSGAAALANELTLRGYPAEALSGDLSQELREGVLSRFRNNQLKVLVATDVAARGLDIDELSHVINFDLPEDPELYLHRTGRTGRAGKSGIALSLVTPRQWGRLRRIEAFTRQRITRAELPAVEDILKRREENLMEQVHVWLQRGRCKREHELVVALAAEGFDPLEIAAVALKMARLEEKQRPVAQLSEVVEHPAPERRSRTTAERPPRNGRSPRGRSSHEEGMVRLSLSQGRTHGVRPGDVVSTIAHYAEIPGSSIGRIQIEKRFTLVDVPEKFVGQVLAKTGTYVIRKQSVEIKRHAGE